MKDYKSFRLIFAVCFAVLLLSACSTPAPTPTPPPPTPTPTPLPTDTPIPSPTATPTSTDTPAPSPTVTIATSTPVPDTSILFTDDFSTPCRLRQGDDQYATYHCENGEYTILVKLAGKSQPEWYGGGPYGDNVIEVDAHAISGPPYVLYGVVFRVSLDGNHFYLFALNRDGHYSLYRWDSPKWTALISPTSSEAVNPDTATNHLKLIAQGNQIALYVNNQWLNTVTDSSLAQGRFGLYVSGADPNAKAGFSNLSISRINNPLALPTGIPTPVSSPTPSRAAPTATAQLTAPPTAQNPCSLDPGDAGILVIDDFDGLMTFTVLNHEYKLPGHSQLLVQVPGGQQFTASVSVVGVGKTNFGPITIDAGKCYRYEPHAG